MAFIGNTPTTQAFTPAVDYFSGNASTTAFTLSRPVASVAQVQVVVNNVAQNPSSAYTISSNTITFTSAPSSGTNNIYVYYTSPITQVIAPSQGSVNTTSLGNITNIASGNSSLTLQTGSSPTTAVTIDTSQKVGIGTSSPNANLQVNGGIQVTGTPTIGSTGVGVEIGYGLVNASEGAIQAYNRSGGAWINMDYSALAHKFLANNSEAMRIDSSGNVFMADTTLYPGDGNTATGLMFQASAGKLFVSASGGNTAFSYNLNGTGTIGYFCSSGTRVGNIGVTGSTTSYNSGSDYRLKNNVQPLTNALSKVALLKPSSWSWKADNSYGDGFIAHELAEVCPNAVNGTKDELDANGNPVYQGVDTSFLVATLTAAIQELKAMNDTQAETINALTARIEALENK